MRPKKSFVQVMRSSAGLSISKLTMRDYEALRLQVSRAFPHTFLILANPCLLAPYFDLVHTYVILQACIEVSSVNETTQLVKHCVFNNYFTLCS